MIDLNKTIADLLKDLAPVQFQFPDTTQIFPRLTIFCINNQSTLIFDGSERLSAVTYQIDTWDTPKNGNTRQRCEQLAVNVSTRMLAQGWKRDRSADMRDPSGLHRTMMQFSGYVDNVTGTVYRASNF